MYRSTYERGIYNHAILLSFLRIWQVLFLNPPIIIQLIGIIGKCLFNRENLDIKIII